LKELTLWFWVEAGCGEERGNPYKFQGALDVRKRMV
jgi:hypothetical protein